MRRYELSVDIKAQERVFSPKSGKLEQVPLNATKVTIQVKTLEILSN